MTAFTQTPTDSAGLADGGTIGLVLPPDSPGPTDALAFGLTKVPTDAGGAVDTQVLDRANVITDSSGTVDTTTVSKGLNSILSEDSGLSDVATPVVILSQMPTDPVGLTDASSRVSDRAQIPTDPSGLVDLAGFFTSKVLTDAGLSTDLSAVSHGWIIQPQDSAGATDAGVVEGSAANITDGSGLSDSAVASLALKVQQAANDRLGISDSGALLRWDGLANESAGLSDSYTPVLKVGGQTPTDLMGISDGPANFIFRDGYDDNAVLVDIPVLSVSKPINDRAGMSDNALVNKVLTVPINDSLAVSDVVLSQRTIVFVTTDDEDTSDVFAQAATTHADDVIAISDSAGVVASRAISATDRAGMSDVTTQTRSQNLVFDDRTTISETDSYFIRGVFVLNEGTGLQDDIAMHKGMVTSDLVGNADALDLTSIATDRLGISDSISRDIKRVLTDSTFLSDQALPASGTPFDDFEALFDLAAFTQGRVLGDSSGISDGAVLDHVIPLTFNDRVRPLDMLASQSLGKTNLDIMVNSDGTQFDGTKTYGDINALLDDCSISLRDSRLTGAWSFT